MLGGYILELYRVLHIKNCKKAHMYFQGCTMPTRHKMYVLSFPYFWQELKQYTALWPF